MEKKKQEKKRKNIIQEKGSNKWRRGETNPRPRVIMDESYLGGPSTVSKNYRVCSFVAIYEDSWHAKTKHGTQEAHSHRGDRYFKKRNERINKKKAAILGGGFC